MRTASVSLSASGASNPIILDQHLTPQDVGVAIVLSNTPSLTTKLQWTLDNPYGSDGATLNANATWFDDKNLTGLVANTAGVPICAAGFHIPVRALRLNNTVYATGTATLIVSQMGGIA